MTCTVLAQHESQIVLYGAPPQPNITRERMSSQWSQWRRLTAWTLFLAPTPPPLRFGHLAVCSARSVYCHNKRSTFFRTGLSCFPPLHAAAERKRGYGDMTLLVGLHMTCDRRSSAFLRPQRTYNFTSPMKHLLRRRVPEFCSSSHRQGGVPLQGDARLPALQPPSCS